MRRNLFASVILLAVLALTLGACAPASAPPPATTVPEALPEGTSAPASGIDPETGVEVLAETPVLVESARVLTEVVAEPDAWFSSLSHDGAHIAYYLESGRGKDRIYQICIYTFDGAGKKCHTLPSDQWSSYPYQLQWSPDNSMVTFSENPVELGDDADIWLLKVADGTFTNLTDDGVVGTWRQPTGTPGSLVDYLPAWHPTDGKIYFWRFAASGEYLVFNVGIYRIGPEGGEPELVRDLTETLARSTVVFEQERYFLDGPSAMSPDGASIAALVSTADEMGNMTTSLWQISLADPAVAPRQLMTPEAFQAALPEWQEYPAFPTGVAWTADGKAVITIAQSESTHTPFTVFYSTDIASGTVTPVVDFTEITDPEAYFEPAPGSERVWRAYSPWTGSMSPKGDKLIMVNDLTGILGLLTSGLPPSGELPVVSAYAETTSYSTASRSSRSADGKVIVYGLLLKVTE